MTIYTFETKSIGGCDDYGSTHFNVIADSEKQAWKKACEIEYRENIIRISGSRFVHTGGKRNV